MRLVTICGTEKLHWLSRMPRQHGFHLLRYVQVPSIISGHLHNKYFLLLWVWQSKNSEVKLVFQVKMNLV